MKRLVLGATLLAALTIPITVTQGQEPIKLSTLLGDKDGPPQPPVPHSFDNIELSKTQQDSVDAIRKRYVPLLHAINNENKSARVRSSEFLGLIDKEVAEMRLLLTPDQQKVFDKNAAAVKKYDEMLMKQMLSNMAAHGRPVD